MKLYVTYSINKCLNLNLELRLPEMMQLHLKCWIFFFFKYARCLSRTDAYVLLFYLIWLRFRLPPCLPGVLLETLTPLLLKDLFILFCANEWCAHLCPTSMPGAGGGQKKASDSLSLRYRWFWAAAVVAFKAEPGPSLRADRAVTSWTTVPDPYRDILRVH